MVVTLLVSNSGTLTNDAQSLNIHTILVAELVSNSGTVLNLAQPSNALMYVMPVALKPRTSTTSALFGK